MNCPKLPLMQKRPPCQWSVRPGKESQSRYAFFDKKFSSASVFSWNIFTTVKTRYSGDPLDLLKVFTMVTLVMIMSGLRLISVEVQPFHLTSDEIIEKLASVMIRSIWRTWNICVLLLLISNVRILWCKWLIFVMPSISIGKRISNKEYRCRKSRFGLVEERKTALIWFAMISTVINRFFVETWAKFFDCWVSGFYAKFKTSNRYQ